MVLTQAKIYSSSAVEEDGNNSAPLLQREPQNDDADAASPDRRSCVSDVTFGVLGSILGFFVRIVSLQARSLLLDDEQQEDNSSLSSSSSSSSSNILFYSVMSHADLAIHALIWMIFFSILFVCKTEKRRRILTSSVVSLMIGVIAGSFLAWNFVDMTLGFPLSLTSRLLSFNLMLLQCWLLYRCDDVCDQQEPGLQQEKEESAEKDENEQVLFTV